MHRFIPTVVSLVVVSAIYLLAAFIESGPSSDRLSLWRSVRLNVAYHWASTLVLTPIVLYAGPASVAYVNRVGGGLIQLPTEGWRWLLSVLAVLVATDLLEYSYHWAQHRVPFLWRLHALHHSEESLNATTGVRQIWFDQIVRAFVIYPIIGVVFRVDLIALLIVRLLTTVNAAHVHMSWRVSWGPIWWLLNSPQYHRCHHSFEPRFIDRNLAPMFPIWDVLFGTCRRPRATEYPATGIRPSVTPSLGQALLWPQPLMSRTPFATSVFDPRLSPPP